MIDILLIIVAIFALFAWSRALLRFRDRAISMREFIFWTLIWGCAMALTAFRTQLDFLTAVLGIPRPVDVAVYFSIILLFYLMFRLYVKIESVEQNLTKIVREIAVRRKK